MKKLAIILADRFEEIEAVNTIDILRRANVEIDVLGLKTTTITGSHGLSILADDVFDFYGSLDYDGIIFAGGYDNAKSLGESVEIGKLIKHYDEHKKLICAICASPALVIAPTGILEDKDCTCYPAEEFISNLKNANYIDKSVVVCDNIITSQSPFTAFAFALTIVKCLGLEIETLQEELKGMK